MTQKNFISNLSINQNNKAMQITKITFSKTVESSVMGAGVWQKIGIEAVVNEGDDIATAIDEARNVVEDAHKKYLPMPQSGDLYFNVTTQKEER